MSEAATLSAAPESAPAPVAPAPAAPAAPQPSPPTPSPAAPIDPALTPAVAKEAVRGRMHERLAARQAEAAAARQATPIGETPSAPSPTDTPAPSPATPPATVDANGRGHAADGKYTEGAFETPPAAEAPGAEPPAAAPAPAGDPTQPAPAAEAPGTTGRIEIPEGHWLRDRGKRFLDELAPNEVRGLFNDAARRREAVEWQTQAQTAEQRAVVAEAAYTALQEQFLATLGHPEIAERAALIEAEWGPEEKQRYLSGVFTEINQAIAGKVNEAQTTIATRQQTDAAEATGRAFLDTLTPIAEQDFRNQGWPVDAGFRPALQEAADTVAGRWFEREARGERVETNTGEIYEELVHVLWRNPAYRDAKTRRDEEARRQADEARTREATARAEAAARQREQETLTAAATARKTLNPIAQAAPAVGTAGPAPAAPEPDLKNMTPGEIQRLQRDRSRQRLATR